MPPTVSVAGGQAPYQPSVDGTTLQVSTRDSVVTVTLTGETRVQTQATGSLSDIRVGDMVSLTPDAYLRILAATNFKQRTRKMLEYYHADRLNYAVAGTPNLLEYDQGFFVKQGDGAADYKPIAHLYKTQVFSLARHLGLPAEQPSFGKVIGAGVVSVIPAG